MPADATSGSCRFPHAARLKSPREFQSVFQQGRRINAVAFRLHVRHDAAPHERTTPPPVRLARLGISVPKRVAPRAVDRNRIRRVMRESFRRLRSQVPPGDYVLVAQREVVAVSAAALREGLDCLWHRVAALKPGGAAPTMRIPAPKPADPEPPSAPDSPR